MNTRSFFLFSLAILICLPLFGQRQRFRPQVHEVGVQLYSMRAVPRYELAGGISGWAYAHNPLSGIRYKYHLDTETALRASLSYHRGDYSLPRLGPNPLWSPQFDANWMSVDLMLGIEREVNIKRVQLFAGIDAVIGRVSATEQITEAFQTVPILTSEVNTWNVGLNGALGIRYFFNSYASFTLESNFTYLLNNRSRGQFFLSEDIYFPYELGKSQQIVASPVNVYFSYHFKKMKKHCKCPRR